MNVFLVLYRAYCEARSLEDTLADHVGETSLLIWQGIERLLVEQAWGVR